MPIHVYVCSACDHRFERFKKFHDAVAIDTCPMCLNQAPKSYRAGDLGTIQPDGEEYYEEQLDAYVTRSSLKKAMHKINVESDGLVKPEWQ